MIQGSPRGRATATATVVLGLAMGLVASLDGAAETSREEYVARAEPICKQNVLANKRIFKGAKGKVEAGKLKQAATHFKRAAAAFATTIRQLEAVPQPSADKAKLTKWLSYLRAERDFVSRIGAALAAEQRNRAEEISVKLRRNSTRANNAVLGFGFDYCLIDPSRFG